VQNENLVGHSEKENPPKSAKTCCLCGKALPVTLFHKWAKPIDSLAKPCGELGPGLRQLQRATPQSFFASPVRAHMRELRVSKIVRAGCEQMPQEGRAPSRKVPHLPVAACPMPCAMVHPPPPRVCAHKCHPSWASGSRPTTSGPHRPTCPLDTPPPLKHHILGGQNPTLAPPLASTAERSHLHPPCPPTLLGLRYKLGLVQGNAVPPVCTPTLSFLIICSTTAQPLLLASWISNMRRSAWGPEAGGG